MSSETDHVCPGSAESAPLVPSSPRWPARRALQVVFGLAVALLGLLQICRGVGLFAGGGDYGTRLEFNHGDLYYTPAVSGEDADRLGTFLVEQKYFAGKHVSVQLTKDGPTFKVRNVVQPGFEKNEAYVALSATFGAQISGRVFHGEPLEMEMCDAHFKTLRVVPAAAVLKVSHGELYYAAPVSAGEAKRVSEILVRECSFGSAQGTVALGNDGQTVHILFSVRPGVEKDHSYDNAFRVIGASISEEIFRGAPVEVTQCDQQLKPVRVISVTRTLVFNHGGLQYAQEVTKEEAKRLGDYMAATGFFNGRLLNVQLAKQGPTWHVRYASRPGFNKDEAYVATCEIFAARVSLHVFHGAPVEIDLCDDSEQLNTLRAVPSAAGLEFNRGELYYFTASMSRDDAEFLGQYLLRDGFFAGHPVNVQLRKDGQMLQFRLPVRQGLEKDESYLATCRKFAKELSKAVLHGGPVEVHLCDANFRTLRVVPFAGGK
jgi:hypothetical protein